jgi:hypothetical protein
VICSSIFALAIVTIQAQLGWLFSLHDKSVRADWVRFVFERQTAPEQVRKSRFLARLAACRADKPRPLHQLRDVRIGKNAKVLVSAQEKVVQAPAKTFSRVGKCSKPRGIALQEFLDSRISVRTPNAIHTSGFKASIYRPEVRCDARKVLDHVVRVNGIQRFASEWELMPEICPDVTASSKSIGIYVDPSGDIVLLAWAKMSFDSSR